MCGFIKLHRQLTEWGWYSDNNTKSVFLHILLTANFTESEFKGVTIKPGQTVVGRKAMAAQLGLTEAQVRTALDHLRQTGEITIEATNRFSLVTVENWELYQGLEQKATKRKTNKEPKENQQIATLKEGKNIYTIIPPTLEMLETYIKENNFTINPKKFIEYYEENNWKCGNRKMKNWKRTLENWQEREDQRYPRPKIIEQEKYSL